MLTLPRRLYVREPLKTIKPALLRGVATVIVAHARLELLLTELVYDLLRTDYMLGRQVLRGDNPPDIFNIAVRLIRVWDYKLAVNLSRLKKDIRKAYDKRNEVAHGAWVRMKRNDLRIRLVKDVRPTDAGDLDRRIIPEFAKRTLVTFKRDAKFINDVTARVRLLQKQASIELKAWPKTNVRRPPP